MRWPKAPKTPQLHFIKIKFSESTFVVVLAEFFKANSISARASSPSNTHRIYVVLEHLCVVKSGHWLSFCLVSLLNLIVVHNSCLFFSINCFLLRVVASIACQQKVRAPVIFCVVDPSFSYQFSAVHLLCFHRCRYGFLELKGLFFCLRQNIWIDVDGFSILVSNWCITWPELLPCGRSKLILKSIGSPNWHFFVSLDFLLFFSQILHRSPVLCTHRVAQQTFYSIRVSFYAMQLRQSYRIWLLAIL